MVATLITGGEYPVSVFLVSYSSLSPAIEKKITSAGQSSDAAECNFEVRS